MLGNPFTFRQNDVDFFGKIYPSKKVNAVVIIVHGLGDHLGRYEDFVIPELLNNDFSVLAYDQFGHGKTKGKRGYNPGFDQVLESLHIVVKKAVEMFPQKPIFLYGHSMGGNVVLNYALRSPELIQGIVLSSPFLRLAFSPPAWKLQLGKLALKFFPGITMGNELDPKALSHDPKAVEKYLADPLVHDKVSPNYSIRFLESGEWAIENIDFLKLNALVLHGTADMLTDHLASVEISKKNPKKIKLQLYPDGYHELHNEALKETFLKDICTWINKNL
ncbi:alpha/beta hydrolase [Namhaeicola litoreus]|uniref:Alpha/beta hydrolase n=1 Tax=Namhaeicola litoreus TaxID=1052145 RepID=A0ABW3XYC5_9FLAO